MFNVKTDLDGIRAILKPYQEKALNRIIEAGEANKYIGTRVIWEDSNDALAIDGAGPISRASYINFVKALAAKDFILAESGTGKGGTRDNYMAHPGGWNKLSALIATEIIVRLNSAFPDTDLSLIVTEVMF